MKATSIIILIILTLSASSYAQVENTNKSGSIGSGGFDYGLKAGLTIATQQWNGFQRNALFTYHGDLFFDVHGPWSANKKGLARRSSFGGQLGYHQKGSTFRNVFIGTSRSAANSFNNISLTFYGKQAFQTAEKSLFYGGFGLRADYTLHYNLIGFGTEGVNHFNYGVWLAAGMEFSLGRSHALLLEISISPDLSNQILVPEGYPTGLNDINGNPILSRAQKVKNLIFEVSAGFKIKS